MIKDVEKIKVFSGSANQPLAKHIVNQINMPLSKIAIERFRDTEIYVKIEENVRGVDTFVVQPLCRPVSEHLIELMIIIDALRRASAARVTAVIPYFGYARQDRKTSGREPITAKLIANLLVSAGLDRVLTIDLHSDQIQGFFDIPMDHLTTVSLFTEHIQKKNYPNPVIVSPDLGSIKRVRKIADKLDLPIAVFDKVRKKPNTVTKVNLLGDVQGKTAIIIDDMIDTGNTMCAAVKKIIKKEAAKVCVYDTHPVFSIPAPGNIIKLGIHEMVVTDTIPINNKNNKIHVISIAPLLARAIENIHQNKSVSVLFN